MSRKYKFKNSEGVYFISFSPAPARLYRVGKQVTDLVMPNIEFEGEEGRGR